MRRIITPVLVSMALTGCGASEPTSLAGDTFPSPEPNAARHAPAVPIAGSCVLTFNPPPMPPPPAFEQTDRGVCQLSHLGRTQLLGVQVINFAAGTQSGSRTLTAANGDILRATHVGTSAPQGPGRIGFVATLTLTGGTGRFTNATGQLQASGTADLATRTTHVRLDGVIRYSASDRRAR